MNGYSPLAGALITGLLLGSTVSRAADPPAYDGRNLYLEFCASCHGPEGRGDGPVAPALADRLPDLRALSESHGSFPRDRIVGVIDGRTPRAAHGSPEMPVWGWQFQLQDGSEANGRARIDALVDHLSSMQIED